MKIFSSIVCFLLLYLNLYGQELTYKNNDRGEYYYERIINIENKSTNEIHEGLTKFFKSNHNEISYSNDNEIHATLTFDAKYRGHMLFFFNTHDYDAVYDLTVFIKDNKIKIMAENFKFYEKHYKIKTSYWTGFSSSTSIPTSVVNKRLKNFKRKKKPKHLIFQIVENEINELEKNLVNSFNKNDDW
ncbi:MAG: hypothetical protein R2775_03250 [Flavobacteriaceae bacterium]